MSEADAIVVNGLILTMDPALPAAGAIAVRDGRIEAVGSEAEIRARAGARTAVHDAGGRTVVPGLIDTHAHMDREGLRRWYPSLRGARSIEDVVLLVRRAGEAREPGTWIVTAPLGEPPFHLDPAGTLVEGRFPDRHDLDRAAPDQPVWLRSIWGLWSFAPPFVHVLNTAALAACGITRDTPSPASTVTIERDEFGDPTGRIYESSVWPAVEHTLLRAAPRFTPEIREQALDLAMRLHLACGTTSVYEGHGVAAELHDVYKRLHDRDAQPVRVTMPISLPPWSSLAEARRMLADWAHYASGPGFGDDRLRVSGVYLEYGGDPELSEIAARDWPYTGWAGFLSHYIPPDDYYELCREAARLRLRVSTVIGTELRNVLSVWERVHEEFAIDGLRWVLVHGRVTDAHTDLPRIKRLGAVITTQPASYLYRSGLALVENGVDPEQLMAHRDYVEAQIPWALSTDNKPFDLFFTLWVTVARRERVRGAVLGPGQRVGMNEALRAMTRDAAYVAWTEGSVGTIAAGLHADVIALSEDPFTMPVDSLRELRVDFTMSGGQVVYNSGSPIGGTA